MKTMTCLIVDDEPIGLEIIENYVKEIHFLKLVASCEDAFEAMEILENNQIDLLLTDIQMPRINGIEFVASLPYPPLIIFITAHNEFALDGFDLGVVDYLLKPVSFNRFLKAINKAKQQIGALGNSSLNLNHNYEEYFFIKANKKLNKIVFKDILFIESSKDYIKIFTSDLVLVSYSSMKAIEEKLPLGQFVRIHNSYIVSIKAVKAVMGNTVELNSGQSLPISKSRKDELFAVLQINSSD